MKAAMWNVDPSGDFSFSDATDPNQEVLFQPEPDWQQLINILAKEYRGQTVPWLVVAEKIRNSPFRILKKPIKDAACADNPVLQIDNPVGTRRKTIKDGVTQIRFLT